MPEPVHESNKDRRERLASEARKAAFAPHALAAPLRGTWKRKHPKAGGS